MPRELSSKPKPLLLLLAIGLLIYFGINITSTLFHSLQNHQRLQNLQQEVAQLKKKRDTLQKQLQYQQSDRFVEREARDQLGMARANETLVIFPHQQNVLGVTSHTAVSRPRANQGWPANLQKWSSLFW